MPKSKEDIARLVLLEIGELASNQTPHDADARICRDKYDQVYAQLLVDRLVSWGPDDDVPDEAVLSIVALVSRACTTSFGVSGTTLQDIIAKNDLAEPTLRNIMTNDYADEDTPMEYM